MKIAISGKGGVGKTTLVSLLAQGYRDAGNKVIAIDADFDSNLAVNLGFPPNTKITPITELNDLILERTGAAPGASTVFFSLNPRVDDIPDRFAVEHNGIRLMIMGTVRRGGTGCACPEHVMVKELLRHLLVERDEVVLLDTSAGIEHLSRGTAQFVDLLVVVVQATTASIQTFQRIRSMAQDLRIRNISVIANRVRNADDLARIKTETGMEPIGVIDENAVLADYHGTPVSENVRAAIAQTLRNINAMEASHAESGSPHTATRPQSTSSNQPEAHA
jgi:CO dehydrogenase maturation factor